ncbi:metalloendopeptidase [Phormidesmis priestleyi ULC007]|uniref:Metalloendopeptidase n=2 Tax=Phormidesmis priestleyi TaxID=268141 RepID=A0A2T1DCX8_9CYAN|nr:metalloendopeptidase [Phormidesmis priestleyi ULC007]PZO46527.1 MAG: M23 family peptidase [Phormidesmis priestleyi]
MSLRIAPMTHPKTSASTVQKRYQRYLLLCGLGCVVSSGFLGSDITLAQTQTPVLELAPSAPAPAAPASLDPAPELAAPVVTPSAIAPVESGDLFIDRTHYSVGATERRDPTPAAQVVQVDQVSAPVNVTPTHLGSVSVSARGIGWSSSPGSTTAIGREYSTVRDYYNRTIRPPARLGNGNIRLIFPLSIPSAITSVFGWRVHPITGDSRFHSGTDLGAPMGTPVLAAYAGQVAFADLFGGYGLAVAINHNQGTQQTLYGHLSEIFVKPGDIVQQGMVIGRVGSTGASTGPHLHFEFRQLTTEGWVAMDAGTQLETSLADLVKALQVAQSPAKPVQ